MRLLAASLVAALALAVPIAARADGEDRPRRSYFGVSFTGGLILPRGDMKDGVDPGLDVQAHAGWTSRSGFGFLVEGEYAPLRLDSTLFTNVDRHVFVAAAGPRFTLGQGLARPWIYLGGGMVIERIVTDLVVATDVRTEKEWVGRGAIGVDFHFFANGGLTFSGGYTRGLEDKPEYDFFTVQAGLTFTL